MNTSKRFEPRRRARRRALQAIYQWQITGQEAGEILGQFQAVQDLSQVDEEHFEKLLRGVTTDKTILDAALQPFLDRPMEQVDLMERVVLDESVDLARRFGSEQGHSFVNAVLDKAARKWRADEAGSSGSR